IAQHVAAAQHVDAGRLGHLGGEQVRHRLVPHRVEPVALLAERRQPELRHRLPQRVGDRPERAGQVAVVAGPVQVVEERQQAGQHGRGGLLGDQALVPVHALAVVGVLRGDALQVAGAFVQLVAQRRQLGGERTGARLVARALLPGHVLVGHVLLGHRLPGGCTVPGPGAGVGQRPVRTDLALVMDDDAFLVIHFLSSSSTISASTTSSLPSVLAPPGAPGAPGPAVPGPPAAPGPASGPAWVCAYIAAPASWEILASFSCAVLIFSRSEPPSAERSSPSASLISAFFSSGSLSPYSARNFSVCHWRLS